MAKPYIEDISHGYDYDSSIDPPYFSEDHDHYDFTIILRLYMEQANPPAGKRTYQAPDHDGNLWPALRWDRASWRHFIERYQSLVLEVWDKAFVLIPPDRCTDFVYPDGGRRRNLLCRLRVKMADSPDHVHAAIRVVRLATPSRSYFRSDSSLYDSGDIERKRIRYAPEGTSFLHNTPAHEVGHLLGLWHIGVGNPQCRAEGDDACYGSNLTERMNIMGGGGMLELTQASLWLKRIREHVPSSNRDEWKADWASPDVMLRGLQGVEIDDAFKQKQQKPKGLIDI